MGVSIAFSNALCSHIGGEDGFISSAVFALKICSARSFSKL